MNDFIYVHHKNGGSVRPRLLPPTSRGVRLKAQEAQGPASVKLTKLVITINIVWILFIISVIVGCVWRLKVIGAI